MENSIQTTLDRGGNPETGYEVRQVSYAVNSSIISQLDLPPGDLQPNQHGNAQTLGRFVALRFAGIPRGQTNIGAGYDSGWPIGRCHPQRCARKSPGPRPCRSGGHGPISSPEVPALPGPVQGLATPPPPSPTC